MKTPYEIAQHIESIQFDLTEFWKEVESGIYDYSPHKTAFGSCNSINNEQDQYLKAFKIELYCLYYETHNRVYNYYRELCYDTITKIVDYGVSASKNEYQFCRQFSISNNTLPNKNVSILANIAEPSKYINKYLKSKLGSSKASPVKQVEDNAMSLMAFNTYLASLPKGINSTQAINYCRQIQNFKLNREFIEAIVSNCPNPSLKFQKNENGQFKSLNQYALNSNNISLKDKHIALDRYFIRSIAYKYGLNMSQHVLNDRDSEYKPFVTGA